MKLQARPASHRKGALKQEVSKIFLNIQVTENAIIIW